MTIPNMLAGNAMKKHPINLRIRFNNGFSLVDTMVGMVIALLGMIIIFQVFSVSESIKRTTTSGGDAQLNGAATLFSLERALKEAGYGIFASTNLMPIPSDPVATAPVTLTVGAAANNVSDNIAITSRAYALLTSAWCTQAPSPCTPLTGTLFGKANWDLGPFPPDPTVFAAAIPPLLTTETITVNGLTSQLTSDVNGVIADGIVLMKAQYGIDANLDGIVQPGEWAIAGAALAPQNNPPPVQRVLAVRLVVVARSAQPEKLSNNVPCTSVSAAANPALTVTPNPPTWVGTALTPLLLTGQADLLAAGDDWRCYRYKTFENTVQLRNVAWRPY